MSGDYSTARWRRLRATFRKDCERRRLPCHKCRQDIDYSLRHGDPWAWEADHVQPRSTHPELFYRLDNLGPIHARCNYARKDDPIDDTWKQPDW